MAVVEGRAIRAVQGELRQAYSKAANAYPKWQGALAGLRGKLAALCKREGMRAGTLGLHNAREAVQKVHPELLETKRGLMTEDELAVEVVRRIARMAADAARSMDEGVRSRIIRTISEGRAAGQPAADIVDAIEALANTTGQAAATTRSMVASANAEAENASMQAMSEDLGITYDQTWTATDDPRTRETHAEADGQTVRQDESFTVGGVKMRFPKDPDGPPEEVINCRCVAVYTPH